MQPPRAGVDQRRQGVEVGPLQLGQLAVVEHAGGQIVVEGQLFEHFLVGAGSGLRPLHHLQPQFLKEHLLQLLGRVEVEFATGQLVDLGPQFVEAQGGPLALLGQLRNLQPNSLRLHVDQHANQRALEVPVQVPQPLGPQPVPQALREVPGDLGILHGVLGHEGNLDLVHPLLRLAFANELRDGNHLVPQQLARQFIEPVGTGPRLQQVMPDHGVEPQSGDPHPRLPQHQQVVLDVLIHQVQPGVFEHRAQRVAHQPVVEHARPGRSPDRDVPPAVRRAAEGPADNLGLQGIEPGGFEIEAETVEGDQLAGQIGQGLGGVDQRPDQVARGNGGGRCGSLATRFDRVAVGGIGKVCHRLWRLGGVGRGGGVGQSGGG